MRKIYAYTFPEHLTNRTSSGKFLVKVGDTEREPLDRIREQDVTSNAHAPIVLLNPTEDVSFRDYKVHEILESFGAVRERKTREWFWTDVDEVKRAINMAIPAENAT